MKTQIQIVNGDITKVKVDAIINSANPSLLAGGGVDGAIHRAAGKLLECECKELGKCDVGSAKLTQAYDLVTQQVGWIIHTVGPRWYGGQQQEADLLQKAYQSALEIACHYDEIYRQQMKAILEKYFTGNELQQELRWIDEYIQQNPIETIAIPSISTGVYHYPLEEATRIAVSTLVDFVGNQTCLKNIVVVCKDQETYECFVQVLSEKVEN